MGQFDCSKISSREFIHLILPGPQLLILRRCQAVH
ncbi:hypothetical protein BAE44_0021751 [Dichanthelium oligosanthes]|uniref:Uncharacterized protein n=1 Tax=Dichanthelium oligosanthes TaxID=888268 RepID=A0A1E5UWF1_9POAL|nr:hypothetical protein BAE44_0021751 [Dichanthelium oligosanthes]